MKTGSESSRGRIRRRIRRPLVQVLLLATVAVLALAVAGPVTAKKAPTDKGKQRPFSCSAVVTAVNAQAGTITATVKKGSRAIKDYRDDVVTFTVRSDAVILKAGDGDPAPVALGAVLAGDRVHLVGRADLSSAGAPVFTVRLIVDRGPEPLKS